MKVEIWGRKGRVYWISKVDLLEIQIKLNWIHIHTPDLDDRLAPVLIHPMLPPLPFVGDLLCVR